MQELNVIEKMDVSIKNCREHFPIFHHPDNADLVYLDSAATTQHPQQVMDAYNAFNLEFNANAHRGAYKIAEKATHEFETARKKIAQFINAPKSNQIIFTRGATEAVNFLAYGWASHHLKTGDEIVVSELEHHSNLIPWQQVAKRNGATLKFIPFDDEGQLVLDDLENIITSKTKLVAVIHVSNVMGSTTNLEPIIKAAHAVGAKTVIDGSQAVPHIQVDVQQLDTDFYVFSGHKMMAPMGIGVMYGKRDALKEMEPALFGGSMISDVNYTESTWNDIPWKFEAGTQNVPGAIALGAAIDFIHSVGYDNIHDHEQTLTNYALAQLREMDNVNIIGSRYKRGSTISFTVNGVHPHDLATYFDTKNIAIRSGHHCAQLIMRRLEIPATARASFYMYNTIEEVEKFIDELEQAQGYFAKWL